MGTSETENKNYSETSEAVRTTWEHEELEILNFIKILIYDQIYDQIWSNIILYDQI